VNPEPVLGRLPHPPGGRAASEQTQLIDVLAQTAFVVIGVLTRIAAEHDLSLTQVRVLGILRDRRLRMAELADFLGLEKSTLSGLVDRAQKRGLLERGKDAEDGRAVTVFMAPAGFELAQRVEADVHQALAQVTDRLEPGQRSRLTLLLDTMLTDGPTAPMDIRGQR